MRKEWMISVSFSALLWCSCAGTNYTEPLAKTLDSHLDQASVEDYILVQPDAYRGEKSADAFRTRVMAARALPINGERTGDSLYVPGEEGHPAKSFEVNRKRHSLAWQVIDRESEKAPLRYERIRYKGQWWELNSPSSDSNPLPF